MQFLHVSCFYNQHVWATPRLVKPYLLDHSSTLRVFQRRVRENYINQEGKNVAPGRYISSSKALSLKVSGLVCCNIGLFETHIIACRSSRYPPGLYARPPGTGLRGTRHIQQLCVFVYVFRINLHVWQFAHRFKVSAVQATPHQSLLFMIISMSCAQSLIYPVGQHACVVLKSIWSRTMQPGMERAL